jgi:hypothetical protein
MEERATPRKRLGLKQLHTGLRWSDAGRRGSGDGFCRQLFAIAGLDVTLNLRRCEPGVESMIPHE